MAVVPLFRDKGSHHSFGLNWIGQRAMKVRLRVGTDSLADESP